MESKKLSEEILQTVEELQQKSAAIVKELGEIELSKIVLGSRKKAVEEFLKEVNKEQDALVQKIREEYGEGSLNISTGEFYPAEETK